MGLYLLGLLVPSAESVLAIKATNTYGAHSYIWNVFTAGFFNTSIIMALLVSLAFLVMGRFLVPEWGGGELLRFLSFSNLGTGIMVFICQIFYYMTSFNYKYLEQPISGGVGLIAAFAVTVKQRLPEEPISIFGQNFLGLTAKDIPCILVLICAVISLLDLTAVFMQCASGAYFGWLYLRFIQRSPGGLRGDMNDTMAFIMFFPPPLRPAMQVVSSATYKLVCVKSVRSMLDELPAPRQMGSALPTGVFRGVGGDDGDSTVIEVAPPPLPGSDPADKERRRARAMKALQERMAAIVQDTPAAQDALRES